MADPTTEQASREKYSFRVGSELKQKFEDVSWDNRLRMSELIRRSMVYTVDNPDSVMSETTESDGVLSDGDDLENDE